jgi:diacylglycerol kinase family enzyme
VIPAGTGNNFATHVGIPDIDSAFDVLENGDRRRIDLGRADDRPFVNSCVAGLTADASGDTSPELKSRFGVLAYVITTLRSLSEFDGLRLEVDVPEGGTLTTAWEGEALLVLVGNGRRFTPSGDGQADVEDGLLDVTIVEDASSVGLAGEAAVERLFGHQWEHATRMRVPALEIDVREPESIRFSLDGEIVASRTLSLTTQPRAVRIPVGEAYTPHPED